MNNLPGRWQAVGRLAWRDAMRHKARTAVVVAMLVLPVFAGTFLTTMARSLVETPETMVQTRLGDDAQALVEPQACTRVQQHPTSGTSVCEGTDETERATPAEIQALLPAGADMVARYHGVADLRTSEALVGADWLQVDTLAVPGLVPVRSGVSPAGPGHVVIDSRTADRVGVAIGEDLEISHDAHTVDLTVVGLAPPSRNPQLFLGAGTLPIEDQEPSGWLVVGGPVTWETVRDLNGIGALVFSRQVAHEPPPDEEIPQGMGQASWDTDRIGLLAAVGAIGLVQAVLLIGPAFAVGARRSVRDLALVAASGGRPRDLYQIVQAAGLIAGALAALIGTLLGLAAACGAYLVATRLGFSIPNLVLPTWEVGLIVALALGVGAAAAWIPARAAAALDVVAALGGRRSEAAPRRKVPWVGLAIAVAGFALAAGGAAGRFPVLMVGGVLGIQLGLVMSAGAMISLGARLAPKMKTPVRFALRDAQRQRSRTAPAVAAVMVAVAGATAGMSYMSSEAVANNASWAPEAQDGTAYVGGYLHNLAREEQVQIFEEVIRVIEQQELNAEVNTATVLAAAEPTTAVAVSTQPDPDRGCPAGLTQEQWDADPRCEAGTPTASWGWLQGVIIDDGTLVAASGLPGSEEAARALTQGEVVLTDETHIWPDGQAHLELQVFDEDQGDSRPQVQQLPAHHFPVRSPTYRIILPPQAVAQFDLAEHGLAPVTGGVMLTPHEPFSTEEIDRLRLAISEINDQLMVQVEGWQSGDDELSLALLLSGLALIVALVATGLSVGLAAAESRPDLATLAAVGASPRLRRHVAGAQAGVIVVLGTSIGAITGLALAYVLGLWQQQSDGWGNLWEFTVPWLVPAFAITLPLITVCGAMLLTRSRLPTMRRIA